MPSGSYDPLTLPFGILGRPHGLRGELSLRPFNERAVLPAGLRTILVDRPGGRESRTVVAVRQAAAELLITIEGVASREQAAQLNGCVVRLARHALPPPAAGEYYIEDVTGCQVEDQDGRLLGRADGVFWNGAQDVMVVKGGRGRESSDAAHDDRERLIPLVPEYVIAVDAPARLVKVRWSDEQDAVPDGEHGETDV